MNTNNKVGERPALKRAMSTYEPLSQDETQQEDTEYQVTSTTTPVRNKIYKGAILSGGQLVTIVLGSCCRESLSIDGTVLMTNYCLDCQKRTLGAKYESKFANKQQ